MFLASCKPVFAVPRPREYIIDKAGYNISDVKVHELSIDVTSKSFTTETAGVIASFKCIDFY